VISKELNVAVEQKALKCAAKTENPTPEAQRQQRTYIFCMLRSIGFTDALTNATRRSRSSLYVDFCSVPSGDIVFTTIDERQCSSNYSRLTILQTCTTELQTSDDTLTIPLSQCLGVRCTHRTVLS
jgi:hypothetical protein